MLRITALATLLRRDYRRHQVGMTLEFNGETFEEGAEVLNPNPYRR